MSVDNGKPKVGPAPFFETITKAVDPATGNVIRVWRHCEIFSEYPDPEVLSAIGRISVGTPMLEVVEILREIEGVAAIELTDINGLGSIIYLDW